MSTTTVENRVGRNLVICCDGTNNQFGEQNTNVVRLVQVLERDPAKQRLYYDPGVGTLPEPGWVSWFGKKFSELRGLAFGAGVSWKIQQAYCFLMNLWQPGDRVFLFGFSRGAYTVRALAGLLHELGLLPLADDNLVAYAIRLFKTARKQSGGRAEQYWKLRDEFRRTFARPVSDGKGDRRFPVHFLGVWDTVSSVGWVWDPVKLPFTAGNPGIHIVRHAVSIDERRWFFRQNLLEPKDGQDLRELWFPGVHCDVGGGYPQEESGLWRMPFEWMVNEAERSGLLVDPQRLSAVLQAAPAPKPWTDPQHESLTQLWWPAEFFPKWRWRSDLRRSVLRMGLGRHRVIPDKALIDRSALLRIREMQYAPANFSDAFVDKVRKLTDVPEWLPYEKK